MVVSSANKIDLVRFKHPGKYLVYIIKVMVPKLSLGVPHIKWSQRENHFPCSAQIVFSGTGSWKTSPMPDL